MVSERSAVVAHSLPAKVLEAVALDGSNSDGAAGDVSRGGEGGDGSDGGDGGCGCDRWSIRVAVKTGIGGARGNGEDSRLGGVRGDAWRG